MSPADGLRRPIVTGGTRTEDAGVAAFAARTPAKPALVDGERRISFGALDRRQNQVARALARRGIGPGDRVALALRNRVEWFEVVGGAARAGVTVVPVSWRSQRDETVYLMQDSGARLLFVEADAGDVTDGLAAVLLGDQYEAMVAAEEDGPYSSGRDAPLTGFRHYTSGTTGRPKAIQHEFPSGPELEALRAAFTPPAPAVSGTASGPRPLGRGQTEGLEGADEVHLLVGPTYHTAPSAFANRALHYGQTVVVMRRFDAEECLRLIDEHRVTWAHMVPINFVRILQLPDDVRRAYDLSSVRRILHAAAPCPVAVKRSIMEVFPAGSIYEYYGATEGLATVCPADEWLARPGTVGRPAAGVDIRIYDDRGDELPPGAVGTVFFTTPLRFQYAGAPEKTAQAWRGRYFTAGDMGYLDTGGYLFLTDRKIDLIISGGANVYPAEVEGVLITHPAVADVAVFGVPDPEWGERVHAVVEPRAPVTADELTGYCRDRLAHYKCPTSVALVDVLPRDPNGKVRKRLLRDAHWAGREQKI
jgi:long-chain acyl-CoA synthetase